MAEAVSNLTVTLVDGTTPRLTWDPPVRHTDRTTGYRIYRKEASDGTAISQSWSHVLVYRTGDNSYTDH